MVDINICENKYVAINYMLLFINDGQSSDKSIDSNIWTYTSQNNQNLGCVRWEIFFL